MNFKPHQLSYPMNANSPVKGTDPGPQLRDLAKKGKDAPAPSAEKFNPARGKKPTPA